MPKIAFKSFGGIIPKKTPRNLPDLSAQTARNTWLVETNLQPIKAPLTTTTVSADQESIYLWRRGGTTEWLSWAYDVDICRGPISDDQYSSLYFTDGSTLHRKRWISGAKVEEDDVSIAAPTTAVGVAKYKVFKAESFRAYCRRSNSSGGEMQIISAEVSPGSDIAVVKARFIPSIVQTGTLTATIYGTDGAVFWLSFSNISGYSPNVTMDNTTQAAALAFTSDLSVGATVVGQLQLASAATEVDYSSAPVTLKLGTVNTVTYTSYPAIVTFTCNLNFKRSESAYVYYLNSLVDQYGQESPVGPLSALIELQPNDYAGVAPYTRNGYTSRIYRSAAGSTSDDFFFLADGAGYTDVTPSAGLAEKMPAIENPPTAMTGLVSMPGGFYAAFNGKDIYFSEPFLPYSWPTKYRLTVDYDIVGLAVSGNDLLVMTEGTPYFIAGIHPDQMSQSKSPVEQSCVSKRSIAFAEHFVCYASPDGLVSITSGQVKLITGVLYTRDQWQALNPSTMIGTVHDNRFIGFTSAETIILDFSEPEYALSTTDQTCTGVFSDLENDDLYLIQGTNITAWRDGATNLTATWKSKEFQTVKDMIWSAGKVIAETYVSTTFRIYMDGALVWSYVVTNETNFRLPKFNRSGVWSLEIVTVDEIYEVRMATSIEELR